MNIDLQNMIVKSLSNYDKTCNKYSKYINSTNIELDREKTEIFFLDLDKKKFKYEVIGLFHNEHNIWMWAWNIPDLQSNETIIVKKVLNYGLKISLNDYKTSGMYLKTQLVNSRFTLEDEFQLDIHLAIFSYLVKDNLKFIYPRKSYLSQDKTKYFTKYYAIIL